MGNDVVKITLEFMDGSTRELTNDAVVLYLTKEVVLGGVKVDFHGHSLGLPDNEYILENFQKGLQVIIDREHKLEIGKEYEIWAEGPGAVTKAYKNPAYLGACRGFSFINACENLSRIDKEFANGFNREKMTFKGLRLFPTKSQAERNMR